MHEQLKFHKVCAWWVPCQLTNKKCSEWVCPCSTSIGTLRKERRLHGTNCYGRRVLGAPLSTRIKKIFHGMETFHLANKTKVQDESISLQGFAHHVLDKQKFQAHSETVNAMSYCTTLRELRQAICPSDLDS